MNPQVYLLLLVLWVFLYVMSTGQSTAEEGIIDIRSNLVPLDFIYKHPSAYSKKICKRLFDGAKIIKLDNLNKPAVAEIDQVTKSTNARKANEELMEEYLTGVNIILVTSLLSLSLFFVNLGLLFQKMLQ